MFFTLQLKFSPETVFYFIDKNRGVCPTKYALEKILNRRIPRIFYQIKMAGVLGFFVFQALIACKPVPERDLVGKVEQKVKAEARQIVDYTSNKVSTQEMQIVTMSTSTGEVKSATMEVDATQQATGENVGAFDVGTSEVGNPPPKNIGYVITKGVLYRLENGTLLQSKLLLPGETVEVLGKAIIKIRGSEMPALFVEDSSGARGYFSQSNVCNRRICLFADRYGEIEISSFGEIAKRKVPQLRVIFYNLYQVPIRELRMLGRFYYKGVKIGEDSAYPVSVSLGTKPLRPGEYSTVFLRPAFELNVDEKLTPDNYIEVKVLCSVEYRKHEDCGDFKIDQMFY